MSSSTPILDFFDKLLFLFVNLLNIYFVYLYIFIFYIKYFKFLFLFFQLCFIILNLDVKHELIKLNNNLLRFGKEKYKLGYSERLGKTILFIYKMQKNRYKYVQKNYNNQSSKISSNAGRNYTHVHTFLMFVVHKKIFSRKPLNPTMHTIL